jgi:hypothetical protein
MIMIVAMSRNHWRKTPIRRKKEEARFLPKIVDEHGDDIIHVVYVCEGLRWIWLCQTTTKMGLCRENKIHWGPIQEKDLQDTATLLQDPSYRPIKSHVELLPCTLRHLLTNDKIRSYFVK